MRTLNRLLAILAVAIASLICGHAFIFWTYLVEGNTLFTGSYLHLGETAAGPMILMLAIMEAVRAR